MTALVAVYVAAIVAGAACLEWPAAVGTRNQNRYGKQQLAQKHNRYGNPQPAWPAGGASNRAGGGGWAAYGGNIMRHYPVSINRYQTMVAGGGGGGGRRRPNALSDDYYYDADAPSPYDPRPYDRMDYAVVRYPSYGGAGGYNYDPVSAADLASAYDDAAADDGDDDDVLVYDYPAINRYPVLPPPPPPPPLNRYEPARHPTDKIHKFRKVFMSNPVSPSNAFKSTKERQLYDFWESLINGDLDGMERQPDDGADDAGAGGGPQPQPRRPESAAASQLYQHLPPIFQQLQQKQRLQQQRQQLQQQQQQQQQQQPQQDAQQPRQRPAEQRAPPSPSLASSAAATSSASSSSSSSSSIPRGNLYKQWANGSPLIKRSSSDDVLQLERLRANASSTTAATRPAAADGGQREYVLPRPAGEKSGIESLLEVIAEGGIRDSADENAAAAYRKLRQEVKVNKKRSFVSDETSLAAQLGALRKN